LARRICFACAPRRIASAPVLAVLIALLVPTSSEAAWIRLHTEHFTFIGDAPERDIRDIARRMEHFTAVLKTVMPNAGEGTPVPTVVIVFADDKSFTPFKPHYQGKPIELSGYFQPGAASNYIAVLLAQEDYALRVAFHEYTHAVTVNTLSNVPVWLMEGLAQFYEMTADRGGGRRALIGVVPPEHLATLRQQQFMPVDELMAVDYTSPVYNEGNRRGLFYAESWAVVHYLVLGNRARSGQLARYLALLASSAPQAEAFQQAFQTDPKTLEREVRDYVRLFAFPAVDLPLDDHADPTGGRPERMPEWEAQGYLGDFLAHVSSRVDDARTYLERLTAAQPVSPRALAALGALYIRDGKDEQGLALLERAAAAAPADALVQTLLARALADRLRVAAAVGDPDAAVAKVEEVLTRALALDARSADVKALAGYVELFRGEDLPRARALMLEAIRLAPAREDYRLMLVEIYAREREIDRATDVLGALLAQGSTPEIRERARSKLGELAELRKAGSAPRLAAVGAPPAAVPDALSRAEPPRPTDPGGRFIPALRRPGPDESRIVGMFKSVECTAGTVTLNVDTTVGPLRLTAASFQQIEFISYRDDAPKGVPCGAIEPVQRVIATFRRAGLKAGEAEAVAIELLPDGFEPKLNP
jgi:tetratricopeptide (TPR) repeat protein